MVGPNASGKTNLLEAILVLARGSSYRARDIDLIKFQKPWARLEGLYDGHSRVLKLQKDKIPLKAFDIDGKAYNRLTHANRLPIVLFEPNHLQLLSGSPERRRSYLDDFLEQLVAEYGPLQRKYVRVLAQRNALLKQTGHHNSEQLFPWNIRLSQLAGQLVKHRNQLVNKINQNLATIYSELSGSDVKLSIQYKPQLPVDGFESHHLQKLEKNLGDDINSGFTAFGPHRDDFSLLYNNHPAAVAASRGEMRTGILALKITELEVVEEQTGHTPIFLLDDVFSELDGHRRRALSEKLEAGQSFITTTDADVAIKQLAGRCNVIALNQN